jgi:rhodanese-related sulfurtransferase
MFRNVARFHFHNRAGICAALAVLCVSMAFAQGAARPEQLIKWRQSAFQVVAWHTQRIKTALAGDADARELLADPKHLLIVDVRRPDELTKIGGFPAYFSVQIKDLENRLDWIPKDRTIVTVSNHAARSGRAADLLKAKGYEVAGTVGAQTFEEQGGTLTKFEVPPPRTPAATAATAPAAQPGTVN